MLAFKTRGVGHPRKIYRLLLFFLVVVVFPFEDLEVDEEVFEPFAVPAAGAAVSVGFVLDVVGGAAALRSGVAAAGVLAGAATVGSAAKCLIRSACPLARLL